MAATIALKQVRDQAWKLAERSSVFYVFRMPDKRRRDLANMIQMCKPYLDGCVDSKVIAGDDYTRLSLAGTHAYVAADNPGVTLVFSRSIEGVYTANQLNSACLSHSHNFGLMDHALQCSLRAQAMDWYRCWWRAFH